ncbi:MAG: VanZ family protein [Candidatus Omnitrophica bacterium]|nr:VanZ family protein [Candidatus Omnitrophota bacterium]
MIFLLSFRHPGIGAYSLLKEVSTNLAHIPLYSGLGYFILIMLKHFRIKGLISVYTIALAMIIAVTDEFFQSFVPGRSVDARDLMLDLTGVCLAILVFKVVRVKIKKQKKLIILGETGAVS